jgi:MoxR-like ATPase
LRKTRIIVGITNLESNLDAAFMRRFSLKLHIGHPDKRSAKSILKNKLDFWMKGILNECR